MADIYGAVLPIPHSGVERLLSGEKDVLTKYGKFNHLCGGCIIQFYDSHVQGVVGEATISEVEFLTATEAEKKFGERIFLTKDEFKKYTSGATTWGPPRKKERIMTVCVLTKPKSYSRVQKPDIKMNMFGHYLKR